MRGIRSVSLKVAGLAAVAAIWLVAPGAAGAQTVIPPGEDLFETESLNSFLEFNNAGGTGLPLGFFGREAGSAGLLGTCAGFQGTAHLAGIPGGLDPRSLGTTDTIVRRLEPATLNPTGFINIEIVALSLRSVQPIAVNCGNETQHWQLDVTLSDSGPQQPGQMQITETSPQGGIFGSTLPVNPKLTFTRVDGNANTRGETRVIDGLPPSTLNNLVFFQNGGQYRIECVPPALDTRLFCPGLTPGGQKVLTIEQAALARHGVYPAQPSLEHFKCYVLKKKKFKKRSVTLNDQFVNRNARVTSRKELCNPAKKNKEPFLNKRAHQVRYATRGPAINVPVATLNQFGSQILLVKKPQRLMLPSEKEERGDKRKPIQTNIDHFQCYSVETQSGIRSVDGKPKKVKLKDQFRKERVRVKGPKRLCAPVDKNNEGLLSPSQHLLCYAIEAKKHKTRARIHNQFENKTVTVKKPKELCVPTAKQALQ